MFYRILADSVLITHLLYILFALFGAFALLVNKKIIWLHIPTLIWAAYVEFSGTICPLTPLENWLRQQGGGEGYPTSFVEHYLLPLIYPGNLTESMQIMLGTFLLIINMFIYTVVIYRLARRLSDLG